MIEGSGLKKASGSSLFFAEAKAAAVTMVREWINNSPWGGEGALVVSVERGDKSKGMLLLDIQTPRLT